jgi:hypothetical protein
MGQGVRRAGRPAPRPGREASVASVPFVTLAGDVTLLPVRDGLFAGRLERAHEGRRALGVGGQPDDLVGAKGVLEREQLVILDALLPPSDSQRDDGRGRRTVCRGEADLPVGGRGGRLRGVPSAATASQDQNGGKEAGHEGVASVWMFHLHLQVRRIVRSLPAPLWRGPSIP